jgi:uncharacterized protein YqfA (UPF0365 family)
MRQIPLLLAQDGTGMGIALGIIIAAMFAGIFLVIFLVYGSLWFQAYMSNARVSLFSLVGMSMRQVNARTIVQAKIMAMQAGVGEDATTGITTRRLEAHYAGSDSGDHCRAPRRY